MPENYARSMWKTKCYIIQIKCLKICILLLPLEKENSLWPLIQRFDLEVLCMRCTLGLEKNKMVHNVSIFLCETCTCLDPSGNLSLVTFLEGSKTIYLFIFGLQKIKQLYQYTFHVLASCPPMTWNRRIHNINLE